jgi:hypothetical protein
MLESPKGQRRHADADSHNDRITPERGRVAEEIDEGNDDAQYAKSEKKCRWPQSGVVAWPKKGPEVAFRA